MEKSINVCRQNNSISINSNNNFIELIREVIKCLTDGMAERGHSVTVEFTLDQIEANLTMAYKFEERDVAVQFGYSFEEECSDGWYELVAIAVIDYDPDFPQKEFDEHYKKIMDDIFDILDSSINRIELKLYRMKQK